MTFAPYRRSRWPAGLGRDVPLLHWSERTTAADAARLGHGAHRPSHETERTGRRALGRNTVSPPRLLRPAVRVDPWLLRECRLTLAPQLDVGVEADLWFSDIVASRGPSGFVFDPSIANALRGELRQQGNLIIELGRVAGGPRARGLSRVVLIEEQLNGLSVRGAVNDAAVEALLRRRSNRTPADVPRSTSRAGRHTPGVDCRPMCRRRRPHGNLPLPRRCGFGAISGCAQPMATRPRCRGTWRGCCRLTSARWLSVSRFGAGPTVSSASTSSNRRRSPTRTTT